MGKAASSARAIGSALGRVSALFPMTIPMVDQNAMRQLIATRNRSFK